MSSAATQYRLESDGDQCIGKLFREHREGLEWLAQFITGDEKVAAACVIDACTRSEWQNSSSATSLVKKMRIATILSALDTRTSRIAQLSQAHLRQVCMHAGHWALVQDAVELVVQESDLLVARLDVLCRCALVLCGLEKYSVQDAAHLLGIDCKRVENAFCAALEVLDVIGCEHFIEENEFAAVCN